MSARYPGWLDDRVVSAIRDYQDCHGYPPTLRELAAAIGRSVTATRARLVRMRGQRVDWQDNRTRTLRVLDPA